MIFQVNNVARVEHAEIEIKGITLVAGGNACGKSTISKSLYTIMDAFYLLPNKIHMQRQRSRMAYLAEWIYEKPGKNIDSNLRRLLRQELTPIFMQNQLDEATFKVSVKKAFDTVGCEYDNVGQLYVTYNTLQNRNDEYYIQYLVQSEIDKMFSGELNTFGFDKEANINCQMNGAEAGITILKNQVSDINDNGMENMIQPIYITTADLMDSVGSYNKLRSAQDNRSISLANSNLAKLLMTEIDTDNLLAEEYHLLQQQKGMGNNIFNIVLDGEIYLEKNRLAYYDRTYQRNVDFSNLASGMRIFLILRRLIDVGAFLKPTCLIIDEPETNLHPEWQLRLAQLLVLMNNMMGIKVYVNSHSPYFVRAIEYYADEAQMLDKCAFYLMESSEDKKMFSAKNVTEQLGLIYDKLAGPFNQIM